MSNGTNADSEWPEYYPRQVKEDCKSGSYESSQDESRRGAIILTTVVSLFTTGAAGKNLPKQMEQSSSFNCCYSDKERDRPAPYPLSYCS